MHYLILKTDLRNLRRFEPTKLTLAIGPVFHPLAEMVRYIARIRLRLSLVRLVAAAHASIMVYLGMMGIRAVGEYSNLP